MQETTAPKPFLYLSHLSPNPNFPPIRELADLNGNGMRQVTRAEIAPKINYGNINRHMDYQSRGEKSDVLTIAVCSIIYFKK